MMKPTLTLLLIYMCTEYHLTRSKDISECQREALILETHLESKTPKMEPVSGKKLGIHWKKLLNNQTLECLESVELLEGVRVLGSFGKNENYGNFTFEIQLDFCKENHNRFKVAFSLSSPLGEKYRVETQIFKYVPPRYFNDKALPPYCLKGDNVSIALTEHMTNNEFYKHCIEMVEVCQCRHDHDCAQCKKFKRTFGEDAGTIDYQNVLENETKILRLSHFRTNPKLHESKISVTTYLKLQGEHCDGYFGEDVTDASLPLYIIGGAGGGSFLLILIIVIVATVAKQKRKRKSTSESIDINPDYGYNQDGVEYEESALKDANLDYAYSVDDPEYMETGVTDTHTDFTLSIDEEDDKENEEPDQEKII